jgi:hypothetical protein
MNKRVQIEIKKEIKNWKKKEKKEEEKKGKLNHSVELVIHFRCVSRKAYMKFNKSVPSFSKQKANPISCGAAVALTLYNLSLWYHTSSSSSCMT